MEHNPKLSSSELANLWSTYMSDSMNICIMNYFLSNVDDNETEELLIHAKSLSKGHLRTISNIFEQENIPIPQGYTTESDLMDNTPRLYSDTFYTRYLESMGRKGTYGMALGTSYRNDVKTFYLSALNESGELYKKVTDLLAIKGMLVRTPYISYHEKVEFIQDENFMAGYLTLHKRSLLAVEIIHLSNNIESNLVGETLSLGFAQVAENDEVRKYCQKGVKLSREIISSLSKFLENDNINRPVTWDSTVTRNTSSPFSDKLIMAIVAGLNSISIGNIGLGIGASMRSDIVAEYTGLATQVAKYANTGAKIAIKHGWLEKPPQSIDYQKLQNKD